MSTLLKTAPLAGRLIRRTWQQERLSVVVFAIAGALAIVLAAFAVDQPDAAWQWTGVIGTLSCAAAIGFAVVSLSLWRRAATALRLGQGIRQDIVQQMNAAEIVRYAAFRDASIAVALFASSATIFLLQGLPLSAFFATYGFTFAVSALITAVFPKSKSFAAILAFVVPRFGDASWLGRAMDPLWHGDVVRRSMAAALSSDAPNAAAAREVLSAQGNGAAFLPELELAQGRRVGPLFVLFRNAIAMHSVLVTPVAVLAMLIASYMPPNMFPKLPVPSDLVLPPPDEDAAYTEDDPQPEPQDEAENAEDADNGDIQGSEGQDRSEGTQDTSDQRETSEGSGDTGGSDPDQGDEGSTSDEKGSDPQGQPSGGADGDGPEPAETGGTSGSETDQNGDDPNGQDGQSDEGNQGNLPDSTEEGNTPGDGTSEPGRSEPADPDTPGDPSQAGTVPAPAEAGAKPDNIVGDAASDAGPDEGASQGQDQPGGGASDSQDPPSDGEARETEGDSNNTLDGERDPTGSEGPGGSELDADQPAEIENRGDPNSGDAPDDTGGLETSGDVATSPESPELSDAQPTGLPESENEQVEEARDLLPSQNGDNLDDMARLPAPTTSEEEATEPLGNNDQVSVPGRIFSAEGEAPRSLESSERNDSIDTTIIRDAPKPVQREPGWLKRLMNQ